MTSMPIRDGAAQVLPAEWVAAIEESERDLEEGRVVSAAEVHADIEAAIALLQMDHAPAPRR